MKSSRTLALTLAVAAGLALSGSANASTNLDPFAHNRGNLLSPFRVAQAEEEPKPAPPVAPPPAAATNTATTTTAAVACTRDDQCPVHTICEQGSCRTFEPAFNLLLFRKEGANTNFLPIYWSRKGNPGHRVVAPFYWHFWSPRGRTQIVAPFYWRVEDYLAQRVITVIGPYSQTTQPDARSWAVWPLFYSSTKFGWAAPLLGSFRVGDPDHGRAFGLWAFLYFWKRTPESQVDASPLFVSSRSKESSFTWAFPLNFHWRTGKDATTLVVPLAFRHISPEGGNFGSWLGYSSIEGQNKNGSWLWLYWFGRRADSAYDVVFPLVWSFRGPKSSTTVVPPLIYAQRDKWSLGTVFPLAWWAHDEDKGSAWRAILPFYVGTSGEHGKTALHLSLLGGYRRNDIEGSRALTWLAPPILRWHNREREFDSYVLLYWRYRDLRADSTTTVAGPYYQRDDREGTTRVAFPLFWYFRDAASGATAHFSPFHFRRTSADETTTAAGVFPFLGYSRTFADGGSSAGLTPFLFWGQRDGRSHFVLAPLVWHFRDPRSSSTLALPLFYHQTEGQRSNTAIFPLFYFSGRDHEVSYHIQVPLFWSFQDERKGTSTTVAPFYFKTADRQGYAAGIPPLFFWGSSGQQSHFALFPLLWRFRDDAADRTTTVVGPYLHRTEGQQTTDALFPLVHYRRGARPGGNDETSFTLFPLVHYRRDDSHTLFVSPLAAWSRSAERKVGFVGPYFWYRSSTVAASGVPLLYLDHTVLSSGERTRWFGPWFMTDGPEHHSRTFFPLYSHYEDKTDSGTYVFPTYFRRRTTDGYQLDSFLPLYWNSRDAKGRTLMVGPWFRSENQSTGSASTGLLPFYVWAHNAKRDLLLTPLFGYHRNHEAQTSMLISPLVYQSTSPEGSTRVVFPLWWQGSSGTASHAIGFPLYWHFADSSQKKSFSLLFPFVWSRNGSETTRGLFFAWHTGDPEKNSGANALLPLFYESHSPTRQGFIGPLFLFGFGTKPDSLWWYAANTIWSSDQKSSFFSFFPLWFQHHNKITETTTRVIPPLLHYSRTSPDRSLSGTALLFWRRTSVTSSTTLGLPLFYDLHSYNESRLTMFLPFFVRHSSEVTGQTYTVAPLFYRRSGPTDATTVVFPLFWRFAGQDRSTTVLFPFYFGFNRPDWTGTYVFPSIWYSKGRGAEEGTSHLWIVPFWESQVKRPGDYMWEALLGLVGWERIGRNRFLKLFFLPFELEPAPAAQTAWYGKPTKAAVDRRSRGLNVQVW